MAIPFESLLNEGPEDDLKTDWELERGRGLPRKHPSPVDGISGENEEDFCSVFQHHRLRISPAPACYQLDARVCRCLFHIYFLLAI